MPVAPTERVADTDEEGVLDGVCELDGVIDAVIDGMKGGAAAYGCEEGSCLCRPYLKSSIPSTIWRSGVLKARLYTATSASRNSLRSPVHVPQLNWKS